jgi:ATP:ADP antiporter, AAA family
MLTSKHRTPPLMVTAMICAGAVTAQFIGGKATRDALFLGSLNYTALPTMVIATAVCSVVFVALNSSVARRIAPATLIPAYFAASGLLFLAEWLLTVRAPAAAAVIVYLHISGAGPLLGSGFWLIASERFDPRTAKKRFGQIAGAGTIGGLLSAILAERVAALLGAAAMLPFLAAFHLLSAWQVRQLAVQSDAPSSARGRVHSPAAPTQSGLRVLAGSSYLRRLALVVLLGTASAALLDYLFKAEAVRTFGRGDTLLRLFAAFYAGTSLITFVLQTSGSRFVLERFGLAVTTSTPSLALLAGGIGGLIAPGFQSMMIARAGESVFRGSLFRTGYELFYTPIPAAEKRAAKSIIDVGFDRMGDAVGGGLIRVAMFLAPVALQYSTVLAFSMICSVVAMIAASRLNRGYIQTLEKSLLNRAVEIDLSEVEDGLTRTLIVKTLRRSQADFAFARADDAENPPVVVGEAPSSFPADPEIQDILWLRTRNRDRIVEVLHKEDGLTVSLVPHVIPLLAWDVVAPDAVFALRKVAEERVGQLVDALIDPNQDFAVRRRVARVFSVCVSQRAADGLMLGLDDLRFEVRFHCGRSLAAIVDKNPLLRVDRERVFAFVERETAVGRPVWESRRLLDEVDAWEGVPIVDDFVRDRAGQSLAHVFTLLSLVLPREPLQIAFRSLHTDDQYLQGTALEYLEGVLPPSIRHPLWPYLEDRRTVNRPTRPRDEVLADLLRSNKSILINLEELKRRADAQTESSTRADPARERSHG